MRGRVYRETSIISNETDNAKTNCVSTLGREAALLLKNDNQNSSHAFKTKAWKELDKIEKMKAYPKTVLRVRFPDDCVLKAAFHPRERISKLFDLVESSLGPTADGSVSSWSLWTTFMPLQKIEDDRRKVTFAREGLQPRAELVLRFDEGSSVCTVRNGL